MVESVRGGDTFEHRLQLAALVHLAHDVAAADELATHVKLRDRRPVAVLLDPVTDRLIRKHIDPLLKS